MLKGASYLGQAGYDAYEIGRELVKINGSDVGQPDVDYFISESTYGDRLHDDIGMALKELAEVINKTVNRGGKIIIPAFAIERTQEVIYFLHQLVMDNKIPNIPVYVDSPMSTDATAIFKVKLLAIFYIKTKNK